MKLTFTETDLKNRLAALPCSKMVAFAAACAERLIPAYVRYSEKVALGVDTSLYSNALDIVWSQLLGRESDRQSIEDMEKRCLIGIPGEDNAERVGEPYAEDAGATVTFAIRAWLSCDPQDAVWAARRVYEAVDNFIVRTDEGMPSSHLEEQQILAHPLIQRELARQKYDLEQLEAESNE
jgi:uncharacterized protein YjaG (DUF416 family)